MDEFKSELDLQLVPVEDLLREIERRSVCMIFAGKTYVDKDKHETRTFYGKGSWLESVGLASMLQNDVLNNWNGELQTLQRLANDGL